MRRQWITDSASEKGAAAYWFLMWVFAGFGTAFVAQVRSESTRFGDGGASWEGYAQSVRQQRERRNAEQQTPKLHSVSKAKHGQHNE